MCHKDSLSPPENSGSRFWLIEEGPEQGPPSMTSIDLHMILNGDPVGVLRAAILVTQQHMASGSFSYQLFSF